LTKVLVFGGYVNSTFRMLAVGDQGLLGSCSAPMLIVSFELIGHDCAHLLCMALKLPTAYSYRSRPSSIIVISIRPFIWSWRSKWRMFAIPRSAFTYWMHLGCSLASMPCPCFIFSNPWFERGLSCILLGPPRSAYPISLQYRAF